MNQLFSMSIEGSRYFQEVNAREARQLARLVHLDLNYPPPGENVALAGPLGVQAQQQSSATPDDECSIISPRKFEEAMNNSQQNPFRRVRSRRNTEDTEVGVAQPYDFLSTDLIRWGISFGPLGTVNGVISLNDEIFSKTKDTASNVPIAPIVPESEPEAPTFTCVICMGQLIEETSTKCGHIFCKACIEQAIATQHKCPNCRRKLRKRDTFRVHLPYTS